MKKELIQEHYTAVSNNYRIFSSCCMTYGHKNCPAASCRNRNNSPRELMTRSVLFISAPYPIDSKIHLACAVNNYLVQLPKAKAHLCCCPGRKEDVDPFVPWMQLTLYATPRNVRWSGDENSLKFLQKIQEISPISLYL